MAVCVVNCTNVHIGTLFASRDVRFCAFRAPSAGSIGGSRRHGKVLGAKRNGVVNSVCFPSWLVSELKLVRGSSRNERVRQGISPFAQPSESSASVLSEGDDYSEDRESEEEARRRNWIENGWAPWEELRTPEAQFAVDSLGEGEEESEVSWEAYKKLSPNVMEEEWKKQYEEAERVTQEETQKELNREGGTMWDQPLAFSLIPPRDWPPPGWHVDPQELAFIRGSQFLEHHKATAEDLKNVQPEDAEPSFDRWKMFLKQYNEWVAGNKDALEREALEIDPEYYPGRRRTGEMYGDGMHYWGLITSVHLYEGAFVYYGGVHEGWVPIMDNDWYHIRKYIRVGMSVQVEVVAKRDPYRFRFPVEMRLVDPNMDHLIFRRFEYPPIFGRTGDDNLDEVARESNRPYYPKLRRELSPEEQAAKEFEVHPYVCRLWLVHEAEQMSIKDEEDDGEWDPIEFNEEGEDGEDKDDPILIEEIGEGWEISAFVLKVDEQDLDLVSARAERENFLKLAMEAESRGEEFVPPKSRFERRVDELNEMHRQRWFEQQEASARDRIIRLELGLPLEEPGRYEDKSFWGEDPYDPDDPLWRNDYWGDPDNLKEELRKDREPRTRTVDEAVVEDDEDELLDVNEGEGKGVLVEGQEEGDTYQVTVVDGENRVLKDTDDQGDVNEVAVPTSDNSTNIFDMEEGDWKYTDEMKSTDVGE